MASLTQRRNSTGVHGAVHATLLSRPMHVSHESLFAFQDLPCIQDTPDPSCLTQRPDGCNGAASAGESAAAASAATLALRHHTSDQLAYSCRGSFRGPRKWRQLAVAAWAWAQHASTQARQHASTQVHTACASTPVKHEFPHPASSHAHMSKQTHTNLLAPGLARCGSLFCTRERAYTATGQKNVQENPHA